MIAPGPILETARLILRPPAAEDLHGFIAFSADPRSARFVGGVQAPSQSWRYLCTQAGAWALFGYGMFSVVEKASGRWIGRLGPWTPLDWPGTEIGYGLVYDAHGRGYATEACTAAIDWAFDTLGWTEVIHCIDPENRPSQNVAKRLGSSLRGPGRLPPPFEHATIDIWGQTREEWRARRATAA